MSDTIDTNHGSTLRLPVAFGFDLSGSTVSIADANQDVLNDATIDVLNATAGSVMITLTDEQAMQLPLGRLSKFRLQVAFADGSEDLTNFIWINAK